MLIQCFRRLPRKATEKCKITVRISKEMKRQFWHNGEGAFYLKNTWIFINPSDLMVYFTLFLFKRTNVSLLSILKQPFSTQAMQLQSVKEIIQNIDAWVRAQTCSINISKCCIQTSVFSKEPMRNSHAYPSLKTISSGEKTVNLLNTDFFPRTLLR